MNESFGALDTLTRERTNVELLHICEESRKTVLFVTHEIQEAAGYRGFNEIEIFSERNWWKRDPEEVVETCIDRYADFV